MKSRFYYDGHHQAVARNIEDHLNSRSDFLTPQTANSTRAVGDALESIVAEQFDAFLGAWCTEYSSDFARRAMADLAFTDREGIYSVVDVKTHREDTRFNMPNLTSVDGLSRFYESDANVFALMLIRYSIQGTSLTASDVIFVPIEFLDWECLTVGALGWGKIQIANANDVRVRHQYSRKRWMLQLCDAMMEFYPREISKIRSRMDRFAEVRAYWESKQDVWE